MRLLRNRHAAIVFALVLSLVVVACQPGAKLPTKSSNEYNEIVRAFYTGLAALQVGHDVQADSKLAQVTQLAPTEPAGWANWGLLALRQQNFDTAAERLERARSLAPENDQIHYLLGLLESSRGRTAEAIAALRKAVELNPKNLLALYKLAEEVERQGDENGLAEFQQLIQQILSVQPDNLAALLELSRAAAKRGDAATLKSAVTQIAARSIRLANGGAAASCGRASSCRRTRSARRRDANDVFAECADAGARIPAQSSAIKPAPGEEAVPFTHFYAWSRRSSVPQLQIWPFHLVPNLSPTWKVISGIGLARFLWAAPARPLSLWRTEKKCDYRAVQDFHSPVDQTAFLRCPTEFCRSTSLMISKPTWCWPAQEVCVCFAKTIRNHLAT